MVQRVPAHLGETTPEPVSPWIVIAGIVLLVLVSCGVIAVLLDVPSRLAGLAIQAEPTATRTPRNVTPAVTILPVTLPPPTPTPGPTAVIVKYKIKAGDTLSSLSTRYHVSIDAIKAANGMKDDTLRIGDDLNIPLPTPTPPGGASAPQGSAASTPTALSLDASSNSATPATTPGMIRHTVVKGDTLISIAATYGSTVDSTRLANQITGDMLSVGQVLYVPVGSWSPTPAAAPITKVTAAPTSQYSYAAPSLQWPPDNQVVRGSTSAPTLEWLAPATLKANEYYLVHVDYALDGQKKAIVKQVKQGNNVTLAASDYPGPSSNGTPFKWYVVIVSPPSGQVRAETSNSMAFAASPPSETRTFVWY